MTRLLIHPLRTVIAPASGEAFHRNGGFRLARGYFTTHREAEMILFFNGETPLPLILGGLP